MMMRTQTIHFLVEIDLLTPAFGIVITKEGEGGKLSQVRGNICDAILAPRSVDASSPSKYLVKFLDDEN